MKFVRTELTEEESLWTEENEYHYYQDQQYLRSTSLYNLHYKILEKLKGLFALEKLGNPWENVIDAGK